MTSLSDIYKIGKTLASKSYYKYKNVFKNDSIALEDLEQEVNLKIIEIKQKYPTKSENELIKITYKAIVWKLADLRRNAIQCSKNLSIKKEYDDNENHNLEDDEYDIGNFLIKNKFNFEEILSVLTEKEYQIVSDVIKNKKDFDSLSKEYRVSKRQINRVYKSALEKIKNFYLDNN